MKRLFRMIERSTKMTPEGFSLILEGNERRIRHCGSVEITTEDFGDWKQRILFGYRKGIRKEYKGHADALFRNRKAEKEAAEE